MLLFTLLVSGVYAFPAVDLHGSASETLLQTINAVGKDILNIRGMTIMAPKMFRSHTLTQNYDLEVADQSVASSGAQNISFAFQDGKLLQRIDRKYGFDFYWRWASPGLRPDMAFSLVLEDGADGFSCFNNGSNSFFSDAHSPAQGYGDGFLTDYLIESAHQMSLPWLLNKFHEDASRLKTGQDFDAVTNARHITLEHPIGLTMLIDPRSHLPDIIRAKEIHKVYGTTTRDLILSGWQNISGILLPTHYQTVFNSRDVLEDFFAETIIINPKFEPEYFTATPPPPSEEDPQDKNASRPTQSSEYTRSEVHEMYESGLWEGPFDTIYNTSDIKIDHPVPQIQEITSLYIGYSDYVQLLVEFVDGYLITDAPAHRSKIILKWVKQQGKRIKYVVPSHHHRDHAGGVADYVEAGATLVVPERAKAFYTQAGHKWKIETYISSWSKKDSKVQFYTFHTSDEPHAADWTIAVAASVCPAEGQFVLYEVDVINPGSSLDALRWDTGEARACLAQAVLLGLPKSTVVVGSHGSTRNGTSTTDTLSNLAELAGFKYPSLKVGDWKGHE